MAALLDATDSQMAMIADLVESIAAAEATLASMTAARDGLLAAAGQLAVAIAQQGDHPDKGDATIRAIAAEIATAQRVSDRTVERRMSAASWLVDAFPEVWQAQGAGRISAGHSRVIMDAGEHLTDPADRAAFAAAILPLAERESPNRLRPLARRMAERFQERSIDERHEDARAKRRVWVTHDRDAMSDLHLHAPTTLVNGMMDRLTQMAHAIRRDNARRAREAAAADVEFAPDTRTIDEIRADLLVDLVLTGIPTGHDTIDGLLSEIRANVDVTVPVTTLIRTTAPAHPAHADDETDVEAHPGTDVGTDTDARTATEASVTDRISEDDVRSAMAASPPAILDGVVPIDSDTARILAGGAPVWNRVLTHPITGALLAVDRYRPSEQLKRHLRARDQRCRCRFPGCGLPARKCDLDHNQPASTGGATSACNLCAFCRRHHVLKHNSPWHVTPLPGGLVEWTSPTGRVYIDRPPEPNAVAFAPPQPEPAPF